MISAGGLPSGTSLRMMRRAIGSVTMPPQRGAEGGERLRIEHVRRLEPGAPRDRHAPAQVAEGRRGVRVGVDDQLDAAVAGAPGEKVVEVEAIRLAVDL